MQQIVRLGFLNYVTVNVTFRRTFGCKIQEAQLLLCGAAPDGRKHLELRETGVNEVSLSGARGLLRFELNGWSKIRDPVTAKFKHVTVIVTCTLLCCDDVTYVLALWNVQKADLEPYPYGKKIHHYISLKTRDISILYRNFLPSLQILGIYA